jgi:hypothetical protein
VNRSLALHAVVADVREPAVKRRSIERPGTEIKPRAFRVKLRRFSHMNRIDGIQEIGFKV